jgi:hypothetical protein
MKEQSTRAFVLVSTNWHRQIHEKSLPSGLTAVDAKALSFQDLRRLRGATVISFVDKYPFMPVIKRLCGKFILVEEGLGFYRQSKKVPHSLRARVRNFFLGIGAMFILGRFVGYNVEQGKTDLADVIIVRNPELFQAAYVTLRKRRPSPRLVRFDRYFASVPRATLDASIFWGCDYDALGLEDHEIAAFRIAQRSEPDLVYVKHPKAKSNPKLPEAKSVGGSPIEDLISSHSKVRVQYTLASGALVDERIIGESNVVVCSGSSDNGRCIAELFGTQPIGDKMLAVALPGPEGVLLKDVIECELSGVS